jgi:hypothetical protein
MTEINILIKRIMKMVGGGVNGNGYKDEGDKICKEDDNPSDEGDNADNHTQQAGVAVSL